MSFSFDAVQLLPHALAEIILQGICYIEASRSQEKHKFKTLGFTGGVHGPMVDLGLTYGPPQHQTYIAVAPNSSHNPAMEASWGASEAPWSVLEPLFFQCIRRKTVYLT